MASRISDIEATVRLRLTEPTPNFWSSPELTDIIISGIRDLWRDIVDLKQEHYLKVNMSDVFFDANTTQLRGVPADVHKVYLIEPLNTQQTSANVGLEFMPLDYNHKDFRAARTQSPIDPSSDTIYYCITSQGAPVSAPVILCAPQVNSSVAIAFSYVPTLGDLQTTSVVPIPGEANNALVAWTVAFARAKELEGGSPDPNWLAVYATEKQHILQSLGEREYQENTFVEAVFQEYS